MSADFKQGTNLAGRILASGQLATNAVTPVYTVPAGSAAKIATMVLCNDSVSTTGVVTVAMVPAGQAVDGTRVVVSKYPLVPGDSTKITEIEGAFLEAGAFITVKSEPGGLVNYCLTGAVSS